MVSVKDLSKIEPQGDFSFFYESRMENDANGNPIYIGYTQVPNSGTDVERWFIVKVTYDANQSPTRYQLPDAGVAFKYAWDDRATLFS
jgi:hypothetical protein